MQEVGLDVQADLEQLEGGLESRLVLVAVGVAPDLVPLLLHPVGGVDDVGGGHDLPGGDDGGDGPQDVDDHRVRPHVVGDLAHGRHQHGAGPEVGASAVEEESDGAAHGLAEKEEPADVGAADDGGEVVVAVLDEGLEVWHVALQAVGAAVALVVEAVHGVAGTGQTLAGAAHGNAALHSVT